MIRIVHLENFQSHRETVIELHPGVNVFIGQSDQGKSAIIRGLNWLGNNKPRGDAFFSHFANPKKESTVVAVHTTDDIEIGRMKGKIDGNIYYLDDDDYEVPKTSVPPEIAQALNMPEINWQFQHDRPFLLDDSAGEVARTLNRVANLQKIDKSLMLAERKVRSYRSALSYCENDIQDIKQRLDEEVDLEALDVKMKIIGQKQHKVDVIAAELASLIYLTNEIDDFEVELMEMKTDYDSEEHLLDQLLDKSNELQDISLEKKRIVSLIHSIQLKEQTIEKQERELEELEEDYHNEFPDVCPLCDMEVTNG